MKDFFKNTLVWITVAVIAGIAITVGLVLSYYLLLITLTVLALFVTVYVLALVFPKTTSRIMNRLNPNPIEIKLQQLMDAIDEDLDK